MSETQKEQKLAETEEKVIIRLTNEPSRGYEYKNFKFVFKRPAFTNKYKGRAWTTRQLQSAGFGPEVEEEDQDIFIYFRLFGTLNVNVHKIYIKGDDGVNRLYAFDPINDIDYQFLFEKFMIEEIYNKGYNLEDELVFEVAKLQTEWMTEGEIENVDDVKNS